MKTFVLLLATSLTCALAASQPLRPAPTLDMLVADLESGDDGPRQARARQLLPLQGPEVAWKMLPLLDDPRASVHFTALRVLEDVIHESASYPAKEDRERVAQAVLSLVAPESSAIRKETGLRLLPYAVQEEHSLVHVAALLREGDLREKARAALEALGTNNALNVLCNALSGADASFKMDLLRAIAAFDPTPEARKIVPLLDDEAPAVRGAALRALALTGDAALVARARGICAQADKDSAFDAWDGWLRLTDAMAVRGGLWEQANQSYREILETAPHTLIQSGAIVGLGRHGDNTAISVIANALAGEHGAALEPAALEAFQALEGRDVRNALVALFPNTSPTLQVGMLALFGDKTSPEFAALLADYAKHDDETIRTAARRALRRSGSPGSASIFQEILEEASQQTTEWQTERDAALESLADLALRLQQAGDESGAGRAWLAVYQHAEDEATRETALIGIRNNPVPEAFDVVLDLLAAGDIDSLPVDTMMGIALNAIAQGREEEGRGLMDEILPRLTTADAVQRAVNTMRARGPNPEFARLIGVLNRWHFTGPFPWNPATAFTENFIGEPDIALDAVYTAEDRKMQWHVHESQDAGGIFDLSSTIANVENAAAFAYAEIEVAEGGSAQVRAGSDDGLRIWVNGALVHENDVDRGAALDQDVADIELNAGKNTILTLITQRGGGWAFCLRLTHPDGKPLHYQITP